MLKRFEWKWGSSVEEGRNGSVFSGISPGQSRVGSVDGVEAQNSGTGRMRRSSSASGKARLERVRSGGKDVETIEE